jgi:hypothetical protein
VHRADNEDVAFVVVPYADDLERVGTTVDAITGFPVRRSEPHVG